jgi:hypothetical protein
VGRLRPDPILLILAEANYHQPRASLAKPKISGVDDPPFDSVLMLILRNRVQSLPLRLPISDARDRPGRHPKLRDEVVEIEFNPWENKSANVLEQKRARANFSDGAHGLGKHVSVVVLAPEPSALTERLTRRPRR